MPNYVHRTDKTYLYSVSPQDLPEAEANYIMDPDLSAVSGFPSIYWIISGDTVSLMSQAERDAVDAALAAAALQADKDSEEARIDSERVLVALADIIKDEINILRAEHSLADRTLQQLKNAIKANIQGQS